MSQKSPLPDWKLRLLERKAEIAEDPHEILKAAVHRVYEEARAWQRRMQELRCARSIDDPLARAIVAMNEAEAALANVHKLPAVRPK